MVSMILGYYIIEFLFSPWFAIPVLAVAWIGAPWLSDRLPFKRDS
jgi:hypothetical protein